MDLSGAAYFYTLAQVGIGFSGFAAILMGLRQMRGASMSKFHLWVARSYIQSGLLTAINAMLSPLLYGLGLSEDTTWRVASLMIASQSIVLLAAAPRQWRATTKMPVPARLKIHIAAGVLINLFLLLNAAGFPFEPYGGPVMLAVSWNLFAFFLQFAESVSFFFESTEGDLEDNAPPPVLPQA
jgi:hypothetical protein